MCICACMRVCVPVHTCVHLPLPPVPPACRWINAQHLRSLSDEEVHSLVVEQWRRSGLLADATPGSDSEPTSEASTGVLTVG